MGEVTKMEELGIRKLTYDIKKNNEGVYVQFEWTGNDETLQELERYFRIEDNIIKF